MSRFAYGPVFVGLLVLSGCMPAGLRDAVAWKVERERVADAKSQTVEDMPFFRVDDYLLDRLDAAIRLPDNRAGPLIMELFDRSHALAIDASRAEIGRLAPAALQDIWDNCYAAEPAPADLSAVIATRYMQVLEDEYGRFRDSASGVSTAQVREQAALVRKKARRPITAHRGSGVILELVQDAYSNGPVVVPSSTADLAVYERGTTAHDFVPSAFDDAATRSLLEQLAPRIVQEHPANAKYAATWDMIGSVQLGGRPHHVKVAIDTNAPSVYAYSRKVVVADREHVQLVYCYWFPEHPPARRGDPEAGPIDGATIRVTLDSRSRPALIEAVQNCGCHYRCFAARDVDEAARSEFGAAANAKVSSLTRPDRDSFGINVEDLFDLPQDATRGPIVFSPAGSHVPTGISFAERDPDPSRVRSQTRYELHAYELLENMPTDFGRASMFGADGLVHGAGRSEGWLLAGTGMLSAGQPRQRGTQLICWDKRSFDDPHLLETMFRLPKNF